MKTNDIKKMAQAYVRVAEGKSVKEAEGKMTPCPDCEGSMDNHSEDCSRMKKEELKGNQHKLDHNKNGKIDAHDFKLARQKASKEQKEGWDDMLKMVKDKQKEKGTGNFEKKKVSTGTVYQRKANKDGSSKGVKEGTSWEVFKRIMEKKDAHTKGATPPEEMDSKASKGEKDFMSMHGGLNGNDSGIDGAKAAAETAKNATSNVKVAPKRPADQTTGDKTPPKAK